MKRTFIAGGATIGNDQNLMNDENKNTKEFKLVES